MKWMLVAGFVRLGVELSLPSPPPTLPTLALRFSVDAARLRLDVKRGESRLLWEMMRRRPDLRSESLRCSMA
jgi:hypothetical protein